METPDKIRRLANWLGTGSINIFGIPFSGKDTVGKRLADELHASFLSSGDIIRSARLAAPAHIQAAVKVSDNGTWMPTNEFRELIVPYLYSPDIEGRALILSMVGRWIGEEGPVLAALQKGGHQTKAVVLLNITEDAAWQRQAAVTDPDSRNIGRLDDGETQKVQGRFDDFRHKTLPVIDTYRQMGILIEVDGEQSRDNVYREVVDKLYEFSLASASQ